MGGLRLGWEGDDARFLSYSLNPYHVLRTTFFSATHVVKQSELHLVAKKTRKCVDFLPIDEAVASRAVFGIVSASDGRTGGRKCSFWIQLNNSKTVRDRPYVSYNGELIGINVRGIESAHPWSPRTPNRGVVNWRPQIEHIMWGRRTVWSPLCWWPCDFYQLTARLSSIYLAIQWYDMIFICKS